MNWKTIVSNIYKEEYEPTNSIYIFLRTTISMQNAEQNRMKHLIEAAIIDLCTSTSLPRNMVITDLGCSSGSNALVLVSIAIEAIQSYCIQFRKEPPEVCIFLNDLPNNDFNMVVKSLVMLRRSNEPTVVASVTPGSFYERLFASDSLHLVCSSSSLHWLSKVCHFHYSMDWLVALHHLWIM
jgi:jasmonate O-methyltransferase